MEKGLFIKLGICSLLLVSGCAKNDKYKNLSIYEYHRYSEDTKYSKDLIAKYTESGELYSLELQYNYDQRDSCGYTDNR